MNEGTPTWRINKDRERVEHECEERAREEASDTLRSRARLFELLTEFGAMEEGDIASELMAVVAPCYDVNPAAKRLRHLLWYAAYRRALAAERRKEGLE